jgi:hypothetical protein
MITSTDSTVVTLDSIHATLQSVVASLETVETRLEPRVSMVFYAPHALSCSCCPCSHSDQRSHAKRTSHTTQDASQMITRHPELNVR